MAEEVSAVGAAMEMARLASAALYSAALAYFGNKVQRRDFLQLVLSGEKGRRSSSSRTSGYIRCRWRTSLCRGMGLQVTPRDCLSNAISDARFMMIGGGTSEIMRYIIQREVYREMSRPS